MVAARTILFNGAVYLENEVIENGYVVIEAGRIKEVGPISKMPEMTEQDQRIELPEGSSIIPGFIDLHIHGANGADAMDATEQALKTIATSLPQEGTTSFLATTMTSTMDQIEQALIATNDYIQKSNPEGEAEVLGIHLEGPFISPKRVGAQHPDNVLKPDIEKFKAWQKLAEDHIRLVTLAPEEAGGYELAAYLKEHGVVASVGHSDATYEEVVKAVEAGVTHATHLFNGMRGLHHREPGTVGGVLMHKEIRSEIIVDGIHVHPDMVRFAYMNKGPDGMLLITDAMRAKCLGPGNYDLGGQEVFVDGERATLKDGTLAGSMLKLRDAASNMMAFTGCQLRDIIQMASVNPALQINVFDRKGSIKTGKDADIVVLNDKYEVMMTICRGHVAYESQEVSQL